ncbi:hypothetical protein G7054_g11271 [Neopestalotiopsis clavispora]|nr:hypothetical protein G7054_g11271 [Neopestalotiopsis clavispora]
MAPTSAIYDSLDADRKEIRLLTLHESTDAEKLVFVKLETVPFTPETEYIALSYVWGDSHDSVDILVNGTPSSVGANLASALECFHQHKLLRGIPDGRSLPLWVDAISINQKDLHERSEQVAFMGEIYSNATHVFSWLGQPDEKRIDVALDFIRNITSQMDGNTSVQKAGRRYNKRCCSIFDIASLAIGQKITQKGPDKQLPRGYTDLMDDFKEPDELTVKRFLEEISGQPDFCTRDSEHLTGNKIWNAVRNLGHSPYWERVWVQQEMALARATDHCHFFFCGYSHLSMRDLDMFAKLTCHASRVGQHPPRMDETVWHDLRLGLFQWFYRPTEDVRDLRPANSETRDTAFTILFIAVNCKCTNPRDQVYALNAVLGLGMVPNYELSVKDVYLEWFHHEWEKVPSTLKDPNEFIEQALKYAGTALESGKNNQLPSWLPDLSALNPMMITNILLGDRNNSRIAPEHTAYFEGESLNIYGSLCGTINSLCTFSTTWEPNEIEQLPQILKTVDDFIKKQQMQCPANMKANFEPNLEKGLMHVLLQGIDPRDDEILDDWLLFWNVIQYGATKEATLAGISEILSANMNEQERNIPKRRLRRPKISQETIRASTFLKLMVDTIENIDNMQLFRTDNGYVGHCYPAVRSDDQVCILNGIECPVVLRRVDEHWTFVGMCYVYGISYVDALEVIQRDGLKTQWLSIH